MNSSIRFGDLSTCTHFSECIISDGLPLGVILVDPDYGIINWNAWIARYRGESVKNNLGKNIFEVFPEIQERGKDRYIRNCIERQIPAVMSATFHEYLIALTVVRGNKSMRMFQKATIYPPSRSSNRWSAEVGAVILIEDLTDQLLYGDEILAREARYRGIFENVANPILVMNPDGLVLDCNRRIDRLLGCSYGELRGGYFDSILLPENVPRFSKYWKRLLEGKKTAREIFQMPGPEGQILDTQVTSTAVLDHTGEVVQVLSLMEDITDKLRMEAENFKLEKLKSISRLTGGIAHDFNNLLTIIMGNVDFYMEDLPENAIGYSDLFDAREACKRAAELVSQYISFSELGDLDLENVDINQLIRKAAAEVDLNPDIRLELNLAKNPIMVPVDKNQMLQVFVNLLKNAREALPKGGNIGVSIEMVEPGHSELVKTMLDVSAAYVRVKITDDGRGIEKAHLGRLFDPYFSTKEIGVQKGMGLGLTLALSIARRHKGTVTIESVLGKGTDVSVYIPFIVER